MYNTHSFLHKFGKLHILRNDSIGIAFKLATATKSFHKHKDLFYIAHLDVTLGKVLFRL